jgi:small subunit ribosomal protein S6
LDKSRYISPREYEMLTILLPDQGEEETRTAIDKLLSHITSEQGTIGSVAADSPWGRRRLAYPIRHEGVDYRDGHYVLVYFTAMPGALAEIERELKLDTNVVRYLLLTQDPEMGEKIDPSAIAEEGDDAAGETATDPTPAPGEVAGSEEAVTEEPVVESEVAGEEPAADEPAAAAAEEVVAGEPVVESEVAAEEPTAESADAEVAEVAEVEETVVEAETTEETAAEGDVENAAKE